MPLHRAGNYEAVAHRVSHDVHKALLISARGWDAAVPPAPPPSAPSQAHRQVFKTLK